MTTPFEQARAVADAVIYEGYQRSPNADPVEKQRSHWQFGVLVPPACASDADDAHCESRTECVLEAPTDTVVQVRLRFLHTQHRQPEDLAHEEVESLSVDGAEVRVGAEAVEVERDFFFSLAGLLQKPREVPVLVAGGKSVVDVRDGIGRLQGRLVRHRQAVRGVVLVEAEPIPGTAGGLRLRVILRNTTEVLAEHPPGKQLTGLSFGAAHLVIGLREGHFVSQIEPPDWARQVVETCANAWCWPVLLGAWERSAVVLCAPVILCDNPTVAPVGERTRLELGGIPAQSPVPSAEASAPCGDGEEFVGDIDEMPVEVLERLHGTVRNLRDAIPSRRRVQEQLKVPWWGPDAEEREPPPEPDTVLVAGVAVTRGSRVRLNPAGRDADGPAVLLRGCLATVRGVFADVGEEPYMAVTVDGDPETGQQPEGGGHRYFFADEVEPVASEVAS